MFSKLFYTVAYLVVIMAAIAAPVYYVIVKNEQTLITRDIDSVEKRIRSQKNLLAQYKADLQNCNNRFLLKDRLSKRATGLIPIEKSVLVVIPAIEPSRFATVRIAAPPVPYGVE